jgi:hypothetical protein
VLAGLALGTAATIGVAVSGRDGDPATVAPYRGTLSADAAERWVDPPFRSSTARMSADAEERWGGQDRADTPAVCTDGPLSADAAERCVTQHAQR